MASKKMSSNIFHVLNMDTVPTSVSERFPQMGISISELNLPTSEVVIKIFKAYLESFGGVVPQYFNCDQTGIDFYPEVYKDIMPISNFQYIFGILFSANCISEFSFSDITHPNPTRTQSLLAILENFTVYWDSTNENLSSEFEAINQRKELYISLLKENEQLREELNSRASNRAQRETSLKQLIEDAELKNKSIDMLLGSQKCLSEKESQLHSDLHSAKEKYEALSKKVYNIDSKINHLSKQVVPDPDLLVKEQTDLKELLELKEKEVKETNEMLQMRKCHIDQYVQLLESQQHRAIMLKDGNSLEKYLQGRKNAIENMPIQHNTITESVKINEEKVSKLKKDKNTTQDQIIRLKLQKDTKASHFKKSMITANDEGLQLKTKFNDLSQRFSVLEKQLEEFRDRLKKLVEKQVKTSKFAEDKYQEFITKENKFDGYIEHLLKSEIAKQELILSMSDLKLAEDRHQ